jgi:tetratricopeptide (TPR) repeat protein
MNTRVLLIFFIFTGIQFGHSQFFKRNDPSKNSDIQEQAKDDVFALTSTEQFPYADKFHEAVREKLTGNLNRSKELFQECLSENPNNDAVYYGLAEIAKEQRQNSIALEYLKKANQLDPNNIHYTSQIAFLLFEKAEFEEAVTYFEQLVAAEPRHSEWQYGYAQALIYSKDYIKAIAVLEVIEDLMGIIPDLSMIKIDLYRETKQDERVEPELLKIKHAFPNNLEILKTVIGYYENEGNEVKAIELLQELVEKEPENGIAHFILAKKYFEEKEIEKYLNSLLYVVQSTDVELQDQLMLTQPLYELSDSHEQQVITIMDHFAKTHSDQPAVLSMFGDILVNVKQTKRALSFYRASLNYNQNEVKLWTNILAFESAFKEYKALYEDAEKAMTLFPTLPFIYYSAAEGAMYAGDLDEALSYLELGAIYLLDDQVQIAKFDMRKGEILFKKGKNKEARTLFENALEKAPNEGVILSSFAYHLAAYQKEYKTAEKMMVTLLNEPSAGARVYYVLSYIYIQQKEHDKAIRLLETGIEEQNYTAELYDLLGDAYFFKGAIDTAIEKWKTAIQKESRNKVLPQKIEELNYYAPKYY